jgi:tetratricopeptide (TPR) repeat protein
VEGNGNDTDFTEDREGVTRSDLSGSARDVVQARDVSGGIHFHGDVLPLELAPRQLPGDVRGFVGREADLQYLDLVLAQVGETSETVLISTIAGTAGVGKTSLAVHWGHRVKSRFPDGQLHINLRGYDPGPPVTADQALDRFLGALGVAPSAIPSETEAKAALYRSLLAGKRILVILDNAAAVQQVRPLLPGSASNLVVVTSRDRLSGLVARDGARRLDLDVLTEPEAVGLLRDTMAEYRGNDSPESLAELARLCARLPLALRIAAERAVTHPHMPLEDLIRDLKDESSMWEALSVGDEDTDAVHTVFAWSYRALPAEAARLFRLLGLHPGPDFSHLAAAALADVSAVSVLRLLDRLVGAHLVAVAGYDRYQFHDLLRAYASEQAMHEESATERELGIGRLCDWYRRSMSAGAKVHDAVYADDWGVTAAPGDLSGLPSFPDFNQVMIWFSAETDNLIAVSRAAAQAGLDDIAWELPALLRTPYLDQYPVAGWLPLAETALEAARRSGSLRGQAITLLGFGIAHRRVHEIQEAIDYCSGALEAAEAIGDAHQRVAALTMLGHAQRLGRRLDEALQSYEKGLVVAAEEALELWTVWATIGMAEALFDAGRLEEAYTRIVEIMRILPADDSPGARAECLWLLASIEREMNLIESADAHIHDALTIAYDTRNANYEADCETELGRLLMAVNQFDEALVPLQHAASVTRRLGDRSAEAKALDETGKAYRELGRTSEAIDFHRLAIAANRSLGDRWHLACSLNNLGTALNQAGDEAAADESWQEAAFLVADFQDARATALRSSLESRLRRP